MALSGSTDYTLTAEQFVRHALRKLKVIKGDQPKAKKEHLDVGLVDLNLLLKSLPNVASLIWKATPVKLSLVEHKNTYRLGSYANIFYSQKFVTHAIAAAVSGATTVYVAGATTDLANGDSIEFYLNDGTIHSTTISSAISSTSGGVTFTITDALDADLDIRGQVVAWQSEARIPLAISRPVYRDETSTVGQIDIPMQVYSQAEYQDLPDKRGDGSPLVLYYDRQQNGAFIHIWPEPKDADNTVRAIAHMPLDDIDSSSDNIDIRQEMLNGLVYALAAQIGDSLDGIDPATLAVVNQKASIFMDQALAGDDELGSVFFYPIIRR